MHECHQDLYMPTYSYDGAAVVKHFKGWQALPVTERRLKFE